MKIFVHLLRFFSCVTSAQLIALASLTISSTLSWSLVELDFWSPWMEYESRKTLVSASMLFGTPLGAALYVVKFGVL